MKMNFLIPDKIIFCIIISILGLEFLKTKTALYDV